jgi:sulfate adenylyltransferase
VTKHGGLAVCAPIAPYDATRRWVRATVDAAGGPGAFLLVWVSTPLEVCEARDVKGLYAKARRGEVKGFTGIDDPYEEPADADLVIDTSVVPLDEAVDQVLHALQR